METEAQLKQLASCVMADPMMKKFFTEGLKEIEELKEQG